MSNLEQAARQALDAIDDIPSYLQLTALIPHIETLRAALAQQAEQVQAEPVVEPDETYKAVPLKAVRTGVVIWDKQAEPVAWTTMPDADDWTFISGTQDPNGKLEGKWYALYSSPQQQPEPVAWALLRDALGMIRSLPWESETSTQKRGETLEGHRDRMSGVMERNEMRRHLISAIEATLAQQAEPVAWVDERAISWLDGRRNKASAHITTRLSAAKSLERPMALYTAPQQAEPVVEPVRDLAHEKEMRELQQRQVASDCADDSGNPSY
jgi:hypothetical protein